LASLAMVRQASSPPHDAGLERAQGVILVTDGAVQPQDVDQAKAQAVQAGVRVFIVAVGSSAGVEVLAPLAQATGGQLGCVVPGDSIRAAVLRQLARMRQARPVALRCQLDAKPQALTMPAWVYGGDAVRIAARCLQAPGRLDVTGPWKGTLA